MAATDTQPEAHAPAEYDRQWLKEHLERERREGSLLSEIREAVFGAQDGLTSVVAALAPIIPYLFVPVHSAVYFSVALSALLLFGMGVIKSRWTHRNWFISGVQIFGLGAVAGIAGYLFGTVLPAALGVAGVGG